MDKQELLKIRDRLVQSIESEMDTRNVKWEDYIGNDWEYYAGLCFAYRKIIEIFIELAKEG